MEVSWMLLVSLSFASIWISSHAQMDMSMLSKYLPRDTFIIGKTVTRSNDAITNRPSPPATFHPQSHPAQIQRMRDSSQDPVFHRPALPPQNHPLPVNPLHRQHTPDQIRSSTSRFGSGNQVPQLPVVAPSANVPQLPVVAPSANVPQTLFNQAGSGSSSLTQQDVPQKSAVPDTSFVPSGHDYSSSGNQPVNTGSNHQIPSQPPRAQVPTGSFVHSEFPQNIPVNHQQRPVGQIPRRHPMCGILPTPGDCRAAFPRYYFNPQTDQCDCFLYGGCGVGLQYSYRTLQECIETCNPRNTQEGPFCEEIFSDEVFFDTPVDKPISVNQIAPKPNADHLSDDGILYILMNPISTQELAAREGNRLRQKSRVGGTIPG